MKKYLLFAIVMLLPGLAAAQLVTPGGGKDTWDLYVFGNAAVVAHVLDAIRGLITPTSGDTGYATLMLFMATLGFLVMAVKAGFNPSQNLLPMFTYILVAWAISWATLNLKMNVHVIDNAAADGAPDTYLVQNAPAVVALPAVLVSNVGEYFTRVIEGYFQPLPADFRMSTDRTAGFNLFGRMMVEANQFTLSDPNLKNTMRAYMADCVVPAIAAGRFKGEAKGQEVAGVSALVGSDNLLETLATANFNGVYTRYYPMDATGAEAMIRKANPDGSLSLTVDQAMSSGVLFSCSDVYTQLKLDVEEHANALLTATSDQWSSTGTLTPLESRFSSMLAAVGSVGGANKFASFGSPQGFITQKAVINQMSGAMRQAAVQTGNNEFLMAANLAQAEQNQKSAWGASFHVFNNMMGYVYSVLQAFIFAIMPIVIIALFVPGLSRGIFSNYGQILVWLALWMPMLAIINYLIFLFGKEQLGALYGDGGTSMLNSAVTSERTNDLMLAAQMLGVSVPLIAWGLVKGALAFTEFIQSGIGSSMAQQAGASAASGNLSMGNIGMNSLNMDKYNSAMQASVGFMQTASFSGAGALLNTASGGGSTVEAHGKPVGFDLAAASQSQRAIAVSQSVTSTLQSAQSMGLNKQQTFDYAAATMDSQAFNQFLSATNQAGIQWGAEARTARGRSKGEAEDASKQLQTQMGADGSVKVGLSLDVGASGGYTTNISNAQAYAKRHTAGSSTDSSDTAFTGSNGQRTGQNGLDFKRSVDSNSSVRTGHGETKSWQDQLQTAINTSEQLTKSAQQSFQQSQNWSVGGGVDVRSMQDIDALIHTPDAQTAALMGRATDLDALGNKTAGVVGARLGAGPLDTQRMDSFGERLEAAEGQVAAGRGRAGAGAATVQSAQPGGVSQETVARTVAVRKAEAGAAPAEVQSMGADVRAMAESPNAAQAALLTGGRVASQVVSGATKLAEGADELSNR